MVSENVWEVLDRHAMVPYDECKGCIAVRFGFLDDLASSESFTRFEALKGLVRCCIGLKGCPPLDACVGDLDEAGKAELTKVLVVIEHEKQHALQLARVFQVDDAPEDVAQMARSYIVFTLNPTLGEALYRYNLTECDAAIAGVERGFEAAARLVGRETAENAICRMYDYGFGFASGGGSMVTDIRGPFASVLDLLASMARHIAHVRDVTRVTGIEGVLGQRDLAWRAFDAAGLCDGGAMDVDASSAIGNIDMLAAMADFAFPEYGNVLPCLKGSIRSDAIDDVFSVVGMDGVSYLQESSRIGNIAFDAFQMKLARGRNRYERLMSKAPGLGERFENWAELRWSMREGTRNIDDSKGYRP